MRQRTAAARLVTLLMFAVATPAALNACGDSGPASAEAAAITNRSLPAPARPADSADEVAVEFSRALTDAELHRAWDLLPASYQADVTRLVHTFGARMDRDVYNRSFEITRKIAALLAEKKDIILAMPKFQQAPDFDAQRAAANWDHLVSIFATIASSEVSRVESLQRIDVRRFLGTTGSAVMADIFAIAQVTDQGAEKLEQIRNLTASIVSQEGDAAVVRIEVPGQRAQNEDFRRVDGKWIPADIADDWNDEIARAFESLDNFNDDEFQKIKPQVMALMDSLDATIDQLHAAQTPEEFEQFLQMGMFQIFGGVMSISQSMNSAR